MLRPRVVRRRCAERQQVFVAIVSLARRAVAPRRGPVAVRHPVDCARSVRVRLPSRAYDHCTVYSVLSGGVTALGGSAGPCRRDPADPPPASSDTGRILELDNHVDDVVGDRPEQDPPELPTWVSALPRPPHGPTARCGPASSSPWPSSPSNGPSSSPFRSSSSRRGPARSASSSLHSAAGRSWSYPSRVATSGQVVHAITEGAASVPGLANRPVGHPSLRPRALRGLQAAPARPVPHRQPMGGPPDGSDGVGRHGAAGRRGPLLRASPGDEACSVLLHCPRRDVGPARRGPRARPRLARRLGVGPTVGVSAPDNLEGRTTSCPSSRSPVRCA